MIDEKYLCLCHPQKSQIVSCQIRGCRNLVISPISIQLHNYESYSEKISRILFNILIKQYIYFYSIKKEQSLNCKARLQPALNLRNKTIVTTFCQFHFPNCKVGLCLVKGKWALKNLETRCRSAVNHSHGGYSMNNNTDGECTHAQGTTEEGGNAGRAHLTRAGGNRGQRAGKLVW